MRTFEHPNMLNFRCPICDTSDDKPVVLIGIQGTEREKIMEAVQVHFDCLDSLRWHKGAKFIVVATA